MGSRRLGSCCPRFALNGKGRYLSKCVTFAARTPDTGNITGRVLAHSFTDFAGVLLLTTPARSPPLTREAAGVSLWSFPPQFRFAGPPTGACRESNVPVMLSIRLSRCLPTATTHCLGLPEPNLVSLILCKSVRKEESCA